MLSLVSYSKPGEAKPAAKPNKKNTKYYTSKNQFAGGVRGGSYIMPIQTYSRKLGWHFMAEWHIGMENAMR